MQILRSLVLILIIAFVSSCNEVDAGLVSKWRLIELLADPGDGSGTFQPVASNKMIEFYDDGTITSNGSICTLSITSDSPSNGTYNSSTMEIEVEECVGGHAPLNYEILGEQLILNYPCIEACREKYEQVE